jgi:pyruvate/2-oxoglutarate dehydrogenase complex dihydrolipoamide dehydrogenase (E3) component
VPGKDKYGWHVLRNIEDADGIKEQLKQVERITILGSGALGLELANAFRTGPNSRDTAIIEIEPMVAPSATFSPTSNAMAAPAKESSLIPCTAKDISRVITKTPTSPPMSPSSNPAIKEFCTSGISWS